MPNVSSVNLPTPTLRRLMALVIAFVLALGSSVAIAAPAAASAPGSISGSVFGEGGVVIDPSSVLIRSVPDGAYQTSTSVDAAGNFTFTDLAPGQYLLQFDAASGWIDEWWADQPTLSTAVPINVGDGEAVTGIAAVLAPELTPPPPVDPMTASISGAVLGNGRPDVPFDALVRIDSGPDGDYERLVGTDSAGDYTFQNLPAGSYLLYFYTVSPDWTPEWWRDKSSRSRANSISVSVGQARGDINALLEIANPAGTSSISGTLTGAGTPDIPMGNSTVLLLGLDGSAVADVVTNSSGNYTISGVAAGSYTMLFAAHNNIHRQVWWQHANTLDTANTLVVPDATNLTGIDARLDIGASISGTLTAADGTPVGTDTTVHLWGVDGRGIFSTSTTSLGNYKFPTLLPGTYLLQFSAFDVDGYVSEWWDNKPVRANANVVTLTESQQLTGIDAVLAREGAPVGSISGNIWVSQGVPAPNAFAELYNATGSLEATAMTVNGEFLFANVAPGNYKIRFATSDGLWATEWYVNERTQAAAQFIGVAPGQARTGVNAYLSPYVDDSASVSGTVTDDAGLPLRNANIQLYREDGTFVQDELTDSLGHYTANYVVAGNYRVIFQYSFADYLPEWWDNSPTEAAGQLIPVATGQAVTGINAQLEFGGSISGTARDESGNPAASTPVILWAADGRFITASGTDDQGKYSFPMLYDGMYLVQFGSVGFGAYTPEWWDDAPDSSGSTEIQITNGSNATGVDASLTAAASISGSVTGSAGELLDSVQVDAYDSAGQLVGQASGDSAGSYTIGGLGAGSYTLRFSAHDGNWAPEWWDNQPTQALSEEVVVANRQAVVGIDSALAPGATVSGVVSSGSALRGLGPLSSVGVRDVTASLLTLDGAEVARGHTDESGSYRLSNIPAGTYRLKFETSGFSQYGSAWLGGTPLRSDSQHLVVGESEAVTGADVTLGAGGSISGTTTRDGQPVGYVQVTAESKNGDWKRVWSSDAAGQYTLRGLADADYVVSFAREQVGTEWWPEQRSRSNAAIVTILGANDVVGVDAQLALGGRITSGVKGDGVRGVRIWGATVDVFTESGAPIETLTTTLPDGTYTTSWLPAGRYALRFSAPGYATEWWTDSVDLAGSTAVNVVANTTATLPDAALSRLLFDTTPVPTITGSSVVGQTLAALAGTWIPSPQSFAYQWFRDGVAIDGATTSFHPLTNDDAGTVVSVSVTGLKPGYLPHTSVSGSTAVVTGGVLTLPAPPTLSGTPAIGQTITAESGAWGPGAVALSYGWKRNGTTIVGANSRTYVPVAADGGALITLEITGSRLGFASASQTSAPLQIERRLTTTPTPTIQGTPLAVGTTLTSTAGTWQPAPVGLSYQWSRDGAAIPGANQSSYTLAIEDAGSSVTLTVIGEKSGYTSVAKTSTARAVQSLLTDTPDPIITGTPAVGQSLTAAVGTWGPAPVTLRYQWKRNGANVGSNIATYTVRATDAGAQITVSVTGSKAGYTNVTRTSASITVEGRLTATPRPTISGSPLAVGSVLTANAGSWLPAPIDLAYQWNRNGVAVPGATASTYALENADAGSAVSVTVIGSKPTFTSISRTSVARTIQSLLTSTPVPTIGGPLRVGATLVATSGEWQPTPVTLGYQWKRNGVNIGSNSATYVLTIADAGAQITVNVTGSRTAYTSVTMSSAAVLVEGRLTATPTPVITGALAVGQALNATSAEWAPSPVTLSYQWNRGGAPIAGATDPTYTLVVADAGGSVTVTVTGSRSGYTAVVKTSAAKIIQSLLTATPIPTISGTLAVGRNLTATAGSWQPSPVTLRYQWKRNGVAIGSNSATYKLVAADRGAVITVTVTGSKTGHTSSSQESGGLAIP